MKSVNQIQDRGYYLLDALTTIALFVSVSFDNVFYEIELINYNLFFIGTK